jgi:hypothetical protein
MYVYFFQKIVDGFDVIFLNLCDCGFEVFLDGAKSSNFIGSFELFLDVCLFKILLEFEKMLFIDIFS